MTIKELIASTACKILSEGVTADNCTPEMAKEVCEKCVCPHILHKCIDQYYDSIIDCMRGLIVYK